MITVSTKKIHEYVLEDDRQLPETGKPIFYIRTLTASKFSKVINLFEKMQADKSGGLEKVNATVTEILRVSLKKWENLQDDDGQPVEFKYDEVQKILDCLSLPEIYELIEQVLNVNGLSEQQAKN